MICDSESSVERWGASGSLLLLACILFCGCKEHPGGVFDKNTGRRIPKATVFHKGQLTFGDTNGAFSLQKVDFTSPLFVKAPGYQQVSILPSKGPRLRVELVPFEAKGLYISQVGAATATVKAAVMNLLGELKFNTLVVDAKGDRGLLSFDCADPVGYEVGAMQQAGIADPKAFVEGLHRRGIYVIARVSTFKDGLLSHYRPTLAVLDATTGKPWKDVNQVGWVDPYQQEVWRYNLQVAKAAAAAGFDEIVFDCLRFPIPARGVKLKYSQEDSSGNRVAAINGFLDRAVQELSPYNVYLSAVVLEMPSWGKASSDAGQDIGQIAGRVDYILTRFNNPSRKRSEQAGKEVVGRSGEIVTHFLEQVESRLNGTRCKFRLWLDATDEATEGHGTGVEELAAQIRSCEKSGGTGWLLWDARNRYNLVRQSYQLIHPH